MFIANINQRNSLNYRLLETVLDMSMKESDSFKILLRVLSYGKNGIIKNLLFDYFIIMINKIENKNISSLKDNSNFKTPYCRTYQVIAVLFI